MSEITTPTDWTNKTYKQFQKELYALGDPTYLKFNSKIVSTKYKMIGIKVPILRNISSQIKKTSYEDFLKIAKDDTFEEIFIKGVVISYIKDYDKFLSYFHDYLDLIDNWAICDMIISSFKIIKKNREPFLKEIEQLIQSKEEYYVRVGIISLMDYYIEESNLSKLYAYLDSINHDAYYVHMAIAWMVSIMYIKFPKETEEYLKNNKLRKETHNKAIQKIRESTRVSKVEKDYLLKYKH